jgi:hypothetical protein
MLLGWGGVEGGLGEGKTLLAAGSIGCPCFAHAGQVPGGAGWRLCGVGGGGPVSRRGKPEEGMGNTTKALLAIA